MPPAGHRLHEGASPHIGGKVQVEGRKHELMIASRPWVK